MIGFTHVYEDNQKELVVAPYKLRERRPRFERKELALHGLTMGLRVQGFPLGFWRH